LQVLRARKLEVIIVTALVLGVILFLTFRETPLYQGSARVLVKAVPSPTSPVTNPQPPNVDTEREIVLSRAVADRVKESLGLADPPENLLDGVEVEVVTGTEVMQITYTDPNPGRAAELANEFADAYVEFRNEQTVAEFRSAEAGVLSEIDEVEDSLAELAEQIRDAPNQTVRDTLQAQHDTLIAQQGVLQQRLSDIRSAITLNEGGAAQIIQPSNVPNAPVSPNKTRNAILGLLFGSALGVGVAFLRDRLDDTIKGHKDLELRLGAPVLATVPWLSTWRRRGETHLVTVEDPKSPVSEAYRTLRTNLQFAGSQMRLQIIVITSATPGEGKTSTAANLSVAMAHAGRRVVIVSADLRRPRLHRFFGVSNSVGLSDVLGNHVPVLEAVADPGIENLRVVPSGPISPNPAELLQSQAMRDTVEGFREYCDVVIIDSPPVLAVADASILSAISDGTLLVVDADNASRAAITHARDQLRNAGAQLIGSVYNNFNPTAGGPRDAYHYQYYFHYQDYSQDAVEGGDINRSENGRGWPAGIRRQRRSRGTTESVDRGLTIPPD
jgi:capsular exopolysaccharide synthesis family protein